MPSTWHEKKAKAAELAFERELQNTESNFESELKNDTKDSAMGKGDDELFEKKLSKEEKKALAKKKREEKKKAKAKAAGKDVGDDDDDEGGKDKVDAAKLLESARAAAEHGENIDLSINNAAAEALAEQGTICTFATSKKGVDARSRDINVQNLTLQHKGMVMLDGTEIILNHGQRYGIIGRNGW